MTPVAMSGRRLLVAVLTDAQGAALLAGHPRYQVVFASPSVTAQSVVDSEPSAGDAPVVKLLLDYAEAAQALRLSETQVRNLVRAGEIRAVNIGRSRRIPVTELEAYVERLGESVAS